MSIIMNLRTGLLGALLWVVIVQAAAPMRVRVVPATSCAEVHWCQEVAAVIRSRLPKGFVAHPAESDLVVVVREASQEQVTLDLTRRDTTFTVMVSRGEAVNTVNRWLAGR